MSGHLAKPAKSGSLEQTQYLMNLLRERDRDRYLGCLLARQEARNPIAAILALDTEILHIIDTVSDPMVGQIRIQWWRDCLTGERGDEGRANQLASHLMDMVASQGDLAIGIDAWLEQRLFDLYNDPMPDMGTFEGRCGEIYGFQLKTAMIFCGAEQNTSLANFCGYGAMVAGLSATVLGFEQARAAQKLFVPATVLNEIGLSAEGVFAASADDKAITTIYRWLGTQLDQQYEKMQQAASVHNNKTIAPCLWILPKAKAAKGLVAKAVNGNLKDWHAPYPFKRQWQMAKANWFGLPAKL